VTVLVSFSYPPPTWILEKSVAPKYGLYYLSYTLRNGTHTNNCPYMYVVIALEADVNPVGRD